jgi:DnaJ homolog subfamily B member 4
LYTEVEITLKESLCGWSRQVSTIDGKKLPISRAGITRADWSETFPGFGMCDSKRPGVRGELKVHVKILYPQELSRGQLRTLENIL